MSMRDSTSSVDGSLLFPFYPPSWPRRCAIPGCQGTYKGRGYCSRHYTEWYAAWRARGATVTRQSATRYGFTPAQMAIALLLVDGYTNAEICEMTRIARVTLKHHLSEIYDKTGNLGRWRTMLLLLDMLGDPGLDLTPQA